MQIANRTVSERHPVFIAAEIGLNHNGDMELARKTIKAAAAAGACGVKFQNYKTEDFLTDDKLTWEYENNGKTVKESQRDMFKRCELSDNQVKELKEYCDELNVVFHSTPTSTEGVELLAEIGSDVIKNGSDFLTNTPLIRSMAKTGIPIVIATGMADEEEIGDAIAAIKEGGGKDFIVLHCTSSYPTREEDVNLRRMLSIRDRFNCLVGLSDHSEGFLAAVAATALGAVWIEKHFTLDKSLPGPDHRFSCDPAEFKALVASVRATEKILGSQAIKPAASEEEARSGYRLSCAAARSITKGQVLEESDIIFRRPATGIPPSKLNSIIGRKARQDIEESAILTLADLY